MVDEFQDTNRLQCELVDLLTGPDTERFFVGDEFQSIYGFRHADVQVFRERRAGAETLLPLTRNYRSRPEVLAVVNHLFGAEFGEEFQPLAASGEFPDPVFGTPVELLVTDKAAYAGTGVHWRRAEAKNVARRVKELVDTGVATAGEIVLLFAAGTDAEWYEEELRSAGLATYRATGRGYFGQQQVVDLLSYLRLLQNRYDDEALVSVLASPFVGVSNDALLLIRRSGARADLHGSRADAAGGSRSRRHAAPARLPAAVRPARGGGAAALARAPLRADRRRPRLRPRRARAVGRPPALREPAQAGAARALVRGAARPRRRGLRPLRRGAGGGRRGGARRRGRGGGSRRRPAADDPRGQGARVQGRGRRRRRPRSERPFGGRDPLPGRRPLRLPRRRPCDRQAARRPRLRQRQGSPGGGGRGGAAAALLRGDDAGDRPPDRQSGSIDPERKADERTPIGWVLGRLDCAEELAAVGEAPLELEREGARVLVRVDRTAPPAEEPVPALVPAVVDEETGQLALFAAGEEPKLPPLAPALAPIQALPEPPLHDVRRLSYSALALFERCSYRYYAERVAGMREARAHGTVAGQTGLARDRGRRRGAPAARARRPVGAGDARHGPGASVVSGA